MDGQRLINETVRIAGLKNAAELARVLGLSHGAMHHWKNGTSWPDATTAARIAVMQGREPLAGVAAVELERHKDDPAAVKFWRHELTKVREFIFRMRDRSVRNNQAWQM